MHKWTRQDKCITSLEEHLVSYTIMELWSCKGKQNRGSVTLYSQQRVNQVPVKETSLTGMVIYKIPDDWHLIINPYSRSPQPF